MTSLFLRYSGGGWTRHLRGCCEYGLAAPIRREPCVNQNPEAGADASPRAAPAAMLALEWTNRLLARSQSFVAGRYWVAEVLYAAILFSVLFSGGVDNRLSVASGEYWFPAYFQKIEHPLLDVAKINPAGNHEAKLNFRLTVPVILHVLRVPPDQRWVLPVLAACGTAVLLALTCVFAFRVSGDRVCGLYATLAVSATYIGSFGFTMYYDTI